MSLERRIDSNLFVVTMLSADRSWALQPRIAPVAMELGVLVLELLTSTGQDLKTLKLEDVMSLDIASLGPSIAGAIGRIVRHLTPAEMLAIRRELLVGATMDGQPLFTDQAAPIDILLRGRTVTTWKLLFFALQVNYPDVVGFFSRPVDSGASPAVEASRSAGSSTSAGPSGG